MKPQFSKGFSLIEVMVALIICAVGLLGLAKMESLALSSTGIAGARSIAAIEASSMAAAMHANRAFWGTAIAPGTTTITSANAAAITPTCTAVGACNNATKMANYDLQQWAASLVSVLPNFVGIITCTTSTLPVNCTITIKWAEVGVAIDPSQTNMASQTVPTYTVYVEP
jgi:type IV pilus assembly protein PilV